jgi:L-lactate dehydrogenase
LGEHGDTAFVPWSIANVSNVPIEDYRNAILDAKDYPEFDRDEVETYVRKSGARVIEQKGATFYAVSASVNKILSALFAAYDSVATVSSMMHGEYGIEDVCISTMTIIGPNGVKGKVPVDLTDDEEEKLRFSANALKTVIKSLDI